MMPVGRLQAVTAIVMASAIMLILVSPAVPSAPTTLRSKQLVHPLQMIGPVTSLLFTAAVDLGAIGLWLTHQPGAMMTEGNDIVDLTTARLC